VIGTVTPVWILDVGVKVEAETSYALNNLHADFVPNQISPTHWFIKKSNNKTKQHTKRCFFTEGHMTRTVTSGLKKRLLL